MGACEWMGVSLRSIVVIGVCENECIACGTVSVGAAQTNCYLVYDSETLEAVVVDPGNDAPTIFSRLQELSLQLKAVFLTHTHGDHIGALRDVVETTGAPVYVHPNEADWLGDPEKNLSIHIGFEVKAPAADRFFLTGESVEMLGRNWTVIETPGHTPGGVSLAVENIVLTGDALFSGSIGRTDLPGSDSDALVRGIREGLYRLPDDTIVYPGHGSSTTIGKEKRTNPYVRWKD